MIDRRLRPPVTAGAQIRATPSTPAPPTPFTPSPTSVDVFETADTNVHQAVSSDRHPTAALPIVGELTFDTRMEICLYVSRALISADACRVVFRDRVLHFSKRGEDLSALADDGTLVAQADDVAHLLIKLLDSPPG